MIRTSSGYLYSPSDLQNWMTCAHKSALDARSKVDPELQAWLKENEAPRLLADPDDENETYFETPAQLRGDMHERKMLASLAAEGKTITKIECERSNMENIRVAYEQTIAAMRAGVDVVFQATLLSEPWIGYADFLVRVDGVPSSLGDYSYEVRDTKLARTPSASALLQMAFYGQVVEAIQGTPPPDLKVWLGNEKEYSWKYADVEPYLCQAQSRFLQARTFNETTVAEPIQACKSCRWEKLCDESWGPNDLIRVHRLSTKQRALLHDAGVHTIQELAALDKSARPQGMATPTFERLRQQAKAQVGTQGYEIVLPQRIDTGLASIPAADPGDVYFDLEGDPYAGLPTLDYLWAYCDVNDQYFSKWAHTPEAEREAFVWFMEDMEERDRAGGAWHVYHYNAYETSSMRRIARDWPDEAEAFRWSERAEALIEQRFIDLYRAVEVGIRTKAGTTSLKEIEQLAGYDRKKDAAGVAKADESIEQYERFSFSRDEAERADILEAIRHYNEHDVLATKATHLWLLTLATQLRESDLTPAPEPYVPSDKATLKLAEISALRDALLDAAKSGSALPSGLPAVGATHLAYMLEWHRREEAVKYVDYLRLKTWALEEADPFELHESTNALLDELNGAWQGRESSFRPGAEHESCVLDIKVIEASPPEGRKRKWTFTATCRPGSWKVKEGAGLQEALDPSDLEKPANIEVLRFDAAEGTITFATTTVREVYQPFVITPINTGDAAWDALMRLGQAALLPNPGPEFATAFDVLSHRAPFDAAGMASVNGESAQDRARRLMLGLSNGVLPIQGPPGTGKTYLGSHIVIDAIVRLWKDGKSPVIAVTANAHRVIDNMLVSIANRADEVGLKILVAHTGPDDKIEPDPRIIHSGTNPNLSGWLDAKLLDGVPIVVGATKGAWARDDLISRADVLVIDEAGQVTLADALAVSQCAPVVVALGDPMQLAAPVQAAHDEEVNKSLLEYLSEGEHVLPEHVGVFLDETWRMHKDVCAVVSDLAYDGALHPAGDALKRSISGTSFTVAETQVTSTSGVQWIPIDGDDDEEVQAVVQAIDGLITHTEVTDKDGSTRYLSASDILVVAPHNAHVNKLKASVPHGVKVGTVDLFQGQEAHVVIFSMGRVAEGARDVGFLYEINRINVALSRARLMALVISNEEAIFPPVGSPDDLLLASRFIRVVTNSCR